MFKRLAGLEKERGGRRRNKTDRLTETDGEMETETERQRKRKKKEIETERE